MIEVKAPNLLASWALSKVSLFIAGTIDNGNSEDWQVKLVSKLQYIDDLTVFNPRRDNWGPSWEQSYENPEFKEQVDWELQHIELADIIFFYIGKDSKSPISLMELGLVAPSDYQTVIVFCENGFYRKGNVDAICQRYGVTKVDSWDQAIETLNQVIESIK